VGVKRKPGQGPLDFAVLAVGERKDLKAGVEKITESYVKLRYAPLSETSKGKEFKKFRSDVAKFDPRKGKNEKA
jgi:hypothetical protein